MPIWMWPPGHLECPESAPWGPGGLTSVLWVCSGVLCRSQPTSLAGQALITQTKHLMGQSRGEEPPKTPCTLKTPRTPIKQAAEGGTQRGEVLFLHLRATRRKSSCYKSKLAAHFDPAAFWGCSESYHHGEKKWKCFGDEEDFDASRDCWNVLLWLQALCCLTSAARYRNAEMGCNIWKALPGKG